MKLLDKLMMVVNLEVGVENEVGRSLRHSVWLRQDFDATSPNSISCFSSSEIEVLVLFASPNVSCTYLLSTVETAMEDSLWIRNHLLSSRHVKSVVDLRSS